MFARAATFFTVAVALGSAVFAAPLKRQTADVSSVISTLESTVGPILSQINSTIASGGVTEAAIMPLISQVTSALNTAESALGGMSVSAGGEVSAGSASAGGAVNAILKRQAAASDIAPVVAGVVTDITNTLNGLIAQAENALPILKTIVPPLESAINGVLATVEGLLPGVLPLVSGLLAPVTGILSGLGLNLGSLNL